MKTKSLFKSKTAVISIITTVAGAVATFVPSVGTFISDNVASILVGLGGVNFILRLVTKDSVSLFPEE